MALTLNPYGYYFDCVLTMSSVLDEESTDSNVCIKI